MSVPVPPLDELLKTATLYHQQLCPRQVLGIRIGLLAGRHLGLDVPREDKRLMAFVETDGCTLDGISAATGCRVGSRTMRVVDYGKIAATFVDVETGAAVRITPSAESRVLADNYASGAEDRWHAQLIGYQHMPDDELLVAQDVTLTVSLERIISKPGCRAICQSCGEEISNERETIRDGVTLCRSCAGESYYQPLE